jgi:DNA-binding beta-propeller fold protein YncE
MADLNTLLVTVAGASTGNPNAWDLSYAAYDAGADAWDISKAVYSGLSFNVSSQDTVPRGIFFKPDGTKMYVSGNATDTVREYNLSTPWLVTSASYLQLKGIGPQDSNVDGIFFKPDGTKMYIAGATNYKVYEYTLSTAWDISSASFTQDFSVSAQGTSPTSVFFKPDGTKMYIPDSSSDVISEYDLSTPWDISTASYLQNFSVATEETTPTDVFIKPDGTTMYVLGATGDDINQYTLSTPWDVSSASYVQNFSVSGQDAIPLGMFFKPDGSTFYMTGITSDIVYQYVIGGFSVAAQETIPDDIAFKPDGTKMYIVGSDGDDVNEYDLSTAWDITTASFVQNFSVTAQETGPSGLYFKPDGTKMYVCGTTSDNVNEYSLSVAWDISTSSYVRNFSVASQELNSKALSFKTDGTKMYVHGQNNRTVYQYSLSTAWNLSTASYDSVSFSVASQDNSPEGLYFRDDGLLMFISGLTNNKLYKYTLSSAWDVSTASFSQDFSLGVTQVRGIYFKPDGAQFYANTLSIDKVLAYSISPE